MRKAFLLIVCVLFSQVEAFFGQEPLAPPFSKGAGLANEGKRGLYVVGTEK